MSRWAGHDIKFEPHQVGAALSNPKHRSISQQPAIADIQFLEIWSERGDDPDTVIIQPSPSSSPNLESVQKPKNWQFSTRKLISSLQLSKTTRTPLNVISSHWWKRRYFSWGRQRATLTRVTSVMKWFTEISRQFKLWHIYLRWCANTDISHTIPSKDPKPYKPIGCLDVE